MFKGRNSSGSSGNRGGRGRGGGIFGKLQLPHRASGRSQRGSHHVNYQFGFFKKLWSTISGRPPRLPGTTRGKKRRPSTYRPLPKLVLPHHGRRRKIPSAFDGSPMAREKHRGKKRKLGASSGGGIAPHHAHQGKRRKVGLGSMMPAHDPHQGKKRKLRENLWREGVAPRSHGGKKRKSYGFTSVGFYTNSYHQGKKRSKNPSPSKALAKNGYRGQKNKPQSVWVTAPVTHHTGNRGNKHNRYEEGWGRPHVPHKGNKRSKGNKLGASGFGGLPHQPHQGSRNNHHRNKNVGGMPHHAHTGNRVNKHKGTLLTTAMDSHRGSKRNNHKGFRGHHQVNSYTPALFSGFFSRGKYNKVVPSGQLGINRRKRPMKSHNKNKRSSPSSYQARPLRHRYKVKSRGKLVVSGKKRNYTAERMRQMAYFHKTTKGKKRKKSSEGGYQGHVSLNELLRGIILILSILVAITLLLLAITRDEWMGKNPELPYETKGISMVWEICEKKKEEEGKEL